MRLFGTPFSRAIRKLSRRWLSALSSIFSRLTESFSKSLIFIYTIEGSGWILPELLPGIVAGDFRDHAGYHAHRPPPARPVWIPAASRGQSKPPAPPVGKAAMLSMTRP